MKELVILIPTKRGSVLLQVVERYYAQTCPFASVMVCEQGRDYMDMMRNGLEKTNEAFAVFSSDDDFHRPDGLRACIEWLKSYPKYDVAHGTGLQVGIDDLKIQWTAGYPMTADSYFPLFFAVHRRDAFRECLRQACWINEGRSRAAMNHQELAFSCQSDRYRRASLDQLQVIRGHHIGRGQPRTEAAWRGFIERNGGGWLASWLPSRRYSLRAIRRGWNPLFEPFRQFEKDFENAVRPEPICLGRLV